MMYHHDFNEKIGFWYVIALAGQSNGMAYGEGIPLLDTLDKPESRVKQLARRKTITPGGKECKFNEIIPADHCLHDVQDMSGYHQKSIAMINGLSGYGRCSLTLAIHIISAMKVQCCPLPTSILSNHTVFPVYFFDYFTGRMSGYIEKWKEL